MLDAADESDSARDDRLSIDLRRALDRDEIEIRFQPQVSVTDGRIVGVEALARWRHPDHGELGAETLFSIAERSDYLAAALRPYPPPRHRRGGGLAGGARRPCASRSTSPPPTSSSPASPPPSSTGSRTRGFEPGRLTVEVTESGLIEDLQGAAALLAELRAGGLRVAIDDFGTGYSSLAYLKALPLDYLKIDRKLSQDIAGSSRDRVVVRGVIEMARSLGLDVIAEGVETEEQLERLAEAGCTLYQGFLCAPPLETGGARRTGRARSPSGRAARQAGHPAAAARRGCAAARGGRGGWRNRSRPDRTIAARPCRAGSPAGCEAEQAEQPDVGEGDRHIVDAEAADPAAAGCAYIRR